MICALIEGTFSIYRETVWTESGRVERKKQNSISEDLQQQWICGMLSEAIRREESPFESSIMSFCILLKTSETLPEINSLPLYQERSDIQCSLSLF